MTIIFSTISFSLPCPIVRNPDDLFEYNVIIKVLISLGLIDKILLLLQADLLSSVVPNLAL